MTGLDSAGREAQEELGAPVLMQSNGASPITVGGGPGSRLASCVCVVSIEGREKSIGQNCATNVGAIFLIDRLSPHSIHLPAKSNRAIRARKSSCSGEGHSGRPASGGATSARLAFS